MSDIDLFERISAKTFAIASQSRGQWHARSAKMPQNGRCSWHFPCPALRQADLAPASAPGSTCPETPAKLEAARGPATPKYPKAPELKQKIGVDGRRQLDTIGDDRRRSPRIVDETFRTPTYVDVRQRAPTCVDVRRLASMNVYVHVRLYVRRPASTDVDVMTLRNRYCFLMFFVQLYILLFLISVATVPCPRPCLDLAVPCPRRLCLAPDRAWTLATMPCPRRPRLAPGLRLCLASDLRIQKKIV